MWNENSSVNLYACTTTYVARIEIRSVFVPYAVFDVDSALLKKHTHNILNLLSKQKKRRVIIMQCVSEQSVLLMRFRKKQYIFILVHTCAQRSNRCYAWDRDIYRIFYCCAYCVIYFNQTSPGRNPFWKKKTTKNP